MWQAPVAQWIERQFPELKVVGSNPIRRTILIMLKKLLQESFGMIKVWTYKQLQLQYQI
jgi:hypothetical protein